MKKVLAVLLILAAVPAMAQHWHGHGFRHHGHHGYYYGGGINSNWVAPLVIGGFVGAAIANNRRQETVVLQQPVIVQPPFQIPQAQNCTPWTETQHSDGTITRTRTCQQ